MTRRLATVLLASGAALALATASGCHTPVGNYLANRARDFGECWRAELGLGVGAGAGVRALGLGPVGLSVSSWRRDLTIGVSYGEVLPSSDPSEAPWNAERVVLFIGASGRARGLPKLGPLQKGNPAGRGEYGIFSLVSAGLFGKRVFEDMDGLDSTWIWRTPKARPSGADAPPKWWSHAGLHALDIEAHVFAGLVGVRVGFSPGEFLDFLLGWFGADIATDDRAWAPPPE